MSAPWQQNPEFLRSPNISGDPDLYEIENRAADPDGVIEAAMRRIAPWNDKVLMDVGAGTGFHIERFHQDAAHVVAIKPEPDLRIKLMQRIVDRRLTRTSVIGASAASMPLQDSSVDIVHARFAYFFGPGCEPGITEVKRILKPGGTVFIIDNDLRDGTLASWVRSAHQISDAAVAETERFWMDQGFAIERLKSCWRFECREALERVIHLEFSREHAAEFIDRFSGLEIDYNLLLIHARY
jgi:ubiquinone/menaquinone biosynthesis C-methylase UbiE